MTKHTYVVTNSNGTSVKEHRIDANDADKCIWRNKAQLKVSGWDFLFEATGSNASKIALITKIF